MVRARATCDMLKLIYRGRMECGALFSGSFVRSCASTLHCERLSSKRCDATCESPAIETLLCTLLRGKTWQGYIQGDAVADFRHSRDVFFKQRPCKRTLLALCVCVCRVSCANLSKTGVA